MRASRLPPWVGDGGAYPIWLQVNLTMRAVEVLFPWLYGQSITSGTFNSSTGTRREHCFWSWKKMSKNKKIDHPNSPTLFIFSFFFTQLLFIYYLLTIRFFSQNKGRNYVPPWSPSRSTRINLNFSISIPDKESTSVLKYLICLWDH